MSKDQSGIIKHAWESTVRKTQAAITKRRTHSLFGSITTGYTHKDNDGGNSNNYVNENDTEEEEDHYIDKNDVLESLNRDDNGIGEIYQAERVLANGDYYIGTWSGNFPHGQGKYIWTDECMYIGEWFRGKTMGRGKFTWSSGASYEGEFKRGYIDGKGMYSVQNGDFYKGTWVMNLKHGYGVQKYSNGDIYDGEWCRGLQEGNGRYDWKNGNYYIGEWRNGMIFNKGTFFWNNGNRYDGYWEDGMPKGNGTFRWSDGSFYVGNWSKDPREQNGTYYPSGDTLEENLSRNPQDVFNTFLKDCQVSKGEKMSVFPSQKKLAMWRSTKEPESNRPRRKSVDGRVSLDVVRPPIDRTRMLEADHESNTRQDFNGTKAVEVTSSGLVTIDTRDLILNVTKPIKVPKATKKQGEAISKGHKNYELMLNLQLGIRYVLFICRIHII